jgi:hypothetical protein
MDDPENPSSTRDLHASTDDSQESLSPMPKPRRAWTFSPGQKPKESLPGTLRDAVDTKARELIETVLKPKHIQPSPQDERFNYIVDITTKWIGSNCYFFSVYRSPGPHAISPTFETKFARMKYAGDGKFALSFMRHTGQWVELYDDLTVGECLNAIRDDPWFQP